jgi:hypothetical protein
MQNLDKIPQWKLKLVQNSHADTAPGNAAPNSEGVAAASTSGIPWIPIILGSLLAVGIYTTIQNQRDDIKK